MAPRTRRRLWKKEKLVVFWSQREKDFLIRFPRSQDGSLAYYVFCCESPVRRFGETPDWGWDPSFVKELESRGYDTTTLRFSVERKSPVAVGVRRRKARG